jgi:hypothetical protein
MKRLLQNTKRSIVIAFALVLSLQVANMNSATAQLVPRTVLMEEGTNWSCPPCATANPYIETFLNQHVGNVIHIAYHPNWPGADDPMYLNDKTDNQYRVATYYAISGVPDVVFDGMTSFNPQSTTAPLEAAWLSRITQFSPLDISLTRSVSGTTVTVNVTVKVVGDISNYTKLFLRTVAVETEVNKKGPNGEPKYVNAMRTMMPNYLGTPFTLKNGDTKTFTFTYPINASYVAANMYEVAFVQTDAASHEVLQAASSLPTTQFQPTAGTKIVMRTSEPNAMSFSLTNNTSATGHYTVSYAPNSKNVWAVTINGASATNSQSIDLNSADKTSINIAATKGAGTYSSGIVTVKAADGTQSSFPVKFISPDVRVAFVDTFGDSAVASHTMGSLDALSEVYVPLSGSECSLMAGWQPSEFREIVLGAGKGIIDGNDKVGLAAYLNSGGHILVHGGEIAFGLSDAGSVATNDKKFLSDYLKCTYVKDSAGPLTITGVSGDVVSGGSLGPLSMSPTAVEVNQPDEIKLVSGSGATPIFYYGTGTTQLAGLRWEGHSHERLVYLAFGLENLVAASDQNQVIKSSLDWFRSPAGVEGVHAEGFALEQNYPNPFNPSTEIRYTLDKTGTADLTLYDTRGNIVRELASGVQTSGQHSVTLDASGLASGTYFYALRMNGQTIRKAMTLLK